MIINLRTLTAAAADFFASVTAVLQEGKKIKKINDSVSPVVNISRMEFTSSNYKFNYLSLKRFDNN